MSKSKDSLVYWEKIKLTNAELDKIRKVLNLDTIKNDVKINYNWVIWINFTKFDTDIVLSKSNENEGNFTLQIPKYKICRYYNTLAEVLNVLPVYNKWDVVTIKGVNYSNEWGKSTITNFDFNDIDKKHYWIDNKHLWTEKFLK